MIYRQNSNFLRYDDYPFSSYIHEYDPNDPLHAARFAENGCFRFCMPHNHLAVEIMYVLEGTTDIALGNERFCAVAGDIVLANPFDIHAFSTTDPHTVNRFQVINFDIGMLHNKAHKGYDKLITDIEQSGFRFFNHIKSDTALAGWLGAVITDIHDSFWQSDAIAGFAEVLSGLYTLFAEMYKADAFSLSEREIHPQNVVFSQKVVQYVSKNYMYPLSTKVMADVLHLDKSYFCRTFRAVFDQKFGDYLHQYRISVAQSLTPDDYQSLSSLAEAVGYINYDIFATHFKKYTGVTPKAYFKK